MVHYVLFVTDVYLMEVSSLVFFFLFKIFFLTSLQLYIWVIWSFAVFNLFIFILPLILWSASCVPSATQVVLLQIHCDIYSQLQAEKYHWEVFLRKDLFFLLCSWLCSEGSPTAGRWEEGETAAASWGNGGGAQTLEPLLLGRTWGHSTVSA